MEYKPCNKGLEDRGLLIMHAGRCVTSATRSIANIPCSEGNPDSKVWQYPVLATPTSRNSTDTSLAAISVHYSDSFCSRKLRSSYPKM